MYKIEYLPRIEFAKLHAMHACMPLWSMCQCACVPAWFTCQRACMPKACQLLTFYMPNVPTCYTTSQCFNLACQRAKRLANFSVWCANVPKGMPVFQIFPLQNAKENFCTLSLYKKF